MKIKIVKKQAEKSHQGKLIFDKETTIDFSISTEELNRIHTNNLHKHVNINNEIVYCNVFNLDETKECSE